MFRPRCGISSVKIILWTSHGKERFQCAADALGMAVVAAVVNCREPHCTLKAKAGRILPKRSGTISARDSAKGRLYGPLMICGRPSTRPSNTHCCLIL